MRKPRKLKSLRICPTCYGLSKPLRRSSTLTPNAKTFVCERNHQTSFVWVVPNGQ